MSMFDDYKAYKKYAPAYDAWKAQRDVLDTKRQEYVRLHPEMMNQEDIQRGKTLLRAIDIMDEYSQKRAEDMEVATESAIGMGTELALLAGSGLGFFVGNLKPVAKFMSKITQKYKCPKWANQVIPIAIGGVAGTLSIFPLQAWAAKIEVGASRKGRFEAMRKELKNPNGFAVLTDEQIQEAARIAQKMKPEKESVFKKASGNLKALVSQDSEYKKQRRLFNLELLQNEKYLNDELTPVEIEKAKKDQQLLTKLVEKIDIASQDYAENAELAVQIGLSTIMGFSALFSIGLEKILNKCKVKSAKKISAITYVAGVLATMTASIFGAQIQKEASRVGRFKVKQELLKNPEQLMYVDDAKAGEIADVKVPDYKKQGLLNFLKTAWKDKKEYTKYKKNEAPKEKNFYKAIEKLDLTPEQIKDAKRLQRNTFKTFNKIDENSQKYSENIEALGQSLLTPLAWICSCIGVVLGMPFLNKNIKSKNVLDAASNFSKYIGIVLLSTIPVMIGNAYITKEQKKASRVADMLSINELQDYRQFAIHEA